MCLQLSHAVTCLPSTPLKITHTVYVNQCTVSDNNRKTEQHMSAACCSSSGYAPVQRLAAAPCCDLLCRPSLSHGTPSTAAATAHRQMLQQCCSGCAKQCLQLLSCKALQLANRLNGQALNHSCAGLALELGYAGDGACV
jgi:hypothetical protein